MSTLNPDLISKDMDAVLNDAVPLLAEYRKSSIMPKWYCLPCCSGKHSRLAHDEDVRKSRGVDLERLERQIKVAIQSRRDPDGSLGFVAIGNRRFRSAGNPSSCLTMV